MPPIFQEASSKPAASGSRTAHSDYGGYAVTTPNSLFAKELPRLKELKYLGVIDGLARTSRI